MLSRFVRRIDFFPLHKVHTERDSFCKLNWFIEIEKFQWPYFRVDPSNFFIQFEHRLKQKITAKATDSFCWKKVTTQWEPGLHVRRAMK